MGFFSSRIELNNTIKSLETEIGVAFKNYHIKSLK